jgi:hypothetical protein
MWSRLRYQTSDATTPTVLERITLVQNRIFSVGQFGQHLTYPLETIADPASEGLVEWRSRRYFCLGASVEELMEQFGQHPAADGNLIFSPKVMVHEINDLHCPKWRNSG